MTVDNSLYQHCDRRFSLPVVYFFDLAPPDILDDFCLRFITIGTVLPHVVCSENYRRQIHFVRQVKFCKVEAGGTRSKCCD
jgi:hypothetical protein